MALTIGIVADDLTGAADSVAPFAQRGLQATVGWELSHGLPRFRMDEGDALACDTETRELARQPEAAITVSVRRAARRVAELGATVIFKKIDSTLRGHLQVELDAMRQELPGRIALVCPAFPANGRTVQNGGLYLDGMPWTATDFAPPYYLEQPTVRGAFGMAHDTGAADLSGMVIRRGVEAVETELERLRSAGVRTVFCDAADDAHLAVLAETVLRVPAAYLPVGSAGWASALSVQMVPTASHLPARAPAKRSRLLVVVGSLHRASREQLEALNETLGMASVLFSPGHENPREVVFNACDAILARYRAGHRIAVIATHATASDSLNDKIALLGSIVRDCCMRASQQNLPIEGLVLTGGNTAIQVFNQILDAIGLVVEGETQPGIVTARLRAEPHPVTGFSFDKLPVITKAGGFGDRDTLLRCSGLNV